MSIGESLAFGLFLYCLYFLIRLIILEILTPILRWIPPVREPLKRLVARGRMRRDIRSGTLFVAWMKSIGNLMEKVTGRGVARGITFAIVAAAAILLMSLPIKQVSGGAVDEYAAFRAQASAPRGAEEWPALLCTLENMLAEVERQTGKPAFTVPATFSLYPVERQDANLTKLSADNDAGWVFTQQLGEGRRLIATVADLPADVRASKAGAAAIARYARDGKLTADSAHLAPKSEANEKYMERLRNYCAGKPAPGFKALRTLDSYRAIVDRGQTRYLAALDHKKSKQAWFYLQQQMARSEIGLSFMFSLGAGFVLLLAVKMAIKACRMLPSRVWMPLNLILVLVTVVVATTISAIVLSLWTPIARTSGPIIAAAIIAISPQSDNERELQGHANHVAGEAVALKSQICSDLGAKSTLWPACQLADAYFKPWNPETGTFDYGALIPTRAGTADKPGSELGIAMIEKSPLAVSVAFAPTQIESAVPETFDVWSGFARAPIMYLIIGPILLVGVLAIACFVLLDTRRAIVRRVHRIVKPRKSEIVAT